MSCTCTAYPFPHRVFGGRCDGLAAWRAAFEAGEACADCPHAVFITERHPYGEGQAAEHLRDCAATRPRHCPAVGGQTGRGAL